ncbi:DUF3788 domain-containing protein [Enterococcus sp. LJL128]|uniref:DUF3788 domain-containing protein n=1 Tax=Enterococcus sp. LJL51 TaxID=3416656 RepID=UPI003CF2DBB6
MDWNETFNRETKPELEDVTAFIHTKEWEQLLHELTEELKIKPKLEHSRCSIPGWNLKFKKRGKSICTIYPKKGTFRILIIANKEYQAEIEALIEKSDEQIQEAYETYEYMNGGKWLLFDVDNEKILQDARKLMAFRLQ